MKKKQTEFELNSMTLKKLGWTNSEDQWGFKRKTLPQNAKYHLFKGDMTYYIGIVDEEKIGYTFNSYRTSKPDKDGTQKIEDQLSEKIKSNLELFKKIIEAEACTEEYARHFRINKLFR